jgi:hypothetical protein
MIRRLVVLWLLVALPFWLTPATGGPGGETLDVPGAAIGRLMPHAVFHAVYIAILIAAITAIWRLRDGSQSGVIRGVAVALAIAQAAAIAGMVGEEIAVFQNGGLSAGKDVFVQPLHVGSAWVTEPALIVSQVLLIVLTITVLWATGATRPPARTPGNVGL